MSLDAHRHFHDELSHLKVRLLTMSGEAEAALGLAVEALLERDVAKAGEVIAGDRAIDEMEMEIEEHAVNLLALQQPMARDLRMLTSALKIANDLEHARSRRSRSWSRWRASRARCSPMRSRRSCAAMRRAAARCAGATTRWTRCTTRSSASSSPT
jgi:hypothetical protein